MTSELKAQVSAVAEKWLPAFLAGERAPSSIYAAEVIVWHNVGESVHVLDAPPSFSRARSVLPDLHHEDVNLQIHDRGFVLQVTTVGTTPDGTAVRVPACLLVTVKDGRITRFDEYADSVAAAPIVAAIENAGTQTPRS